MKNVAEHEPKMRILLAAKKLFAERGFDGTSVRQICELAGVNVALVSYYFGGKKKCSMLCLNNFIPLELWKVEETFKDPVAGLSLIIREVIRYRWEQPEMAMIMQREIYLESPRRETIKTYVFPVWRRLREILELGKKQGVFHYRSLDNTMLFILATLVFPRGNPFHQPLLTEKLVTVEEQVEDTIRFVFGGLGCPLES